MIYYGHQHITQQDIEAVKKVLESPWLTQGPILEEFERAVAEYCGAKYAVAVTNATSALHIACLAAGLGEGDELWTSPITFTASANCGRYCGANVSFVDIDDKTYNMSVERLAEKLKSGGQIPKIVVPVHFAGQSCDMEKIWALAQQYNFTVLEDASHAMGAEYKGNKVGCCQYSDMAVFSFHPVKMITTGEGGMILTNNCELYQKLLLYRSHGITKNPNFMYGKADGPWYYQQIALGYNYRMTEMQAALGLSQMTSLDTFVERRRFLVERYNKLLFGTDGLRMPYRAEYACPSWHLYVIRAQFEKIGLTKIELFSRMKEKGVMLNLHYIPVHIQPYYRNLGFKQGDYPVSEQYYLEAFTLPLYYDLTVDQQDMIIFYLKQILLGK